MEDKIRLATAKALETLGAGNTQFAVEWPADVTHGDFAVNAALAASKALGKSPREVAELLVPALTDALGAHAEKIEVAGPGFINITLARSIFSSVITEANESGKEWGSGVSNAGKRVMIEYTQPNPFKELHIGHLMSNTIGESVSRLIEFSGATLARANYQGDVGPHVAKALWGLRKAGITEPATAAELGTAYANGAREYEESPDVKAEIDILNKAIYVGEDHDLMELWRRGRDVSLAAFEDLYRILGTKFDYYFFESETAAPGSEIVREALGKGTFEESDGAIIYPGEKKGLHTLVFITSRGTPTYEAKEIGLAFLKEERWPSDESLVLTSVEQIGHFKVVLAALEDIAPALAAKTSHVPNGFLRLAAGKMSSREGNVITTADLIRDVLLKTQERNEDPLIAQQVALAAIKYSILKQSAGSDIIFDFERSLSLEGDSGPYLQYALVRAKSVIAQAEEGKDEGAPAEPYLLERLFIRFPKVVERAQSERAPHHVAQYLTQLAGEWNSFYANNRIRGGEYEHYKLQLARAFVTTMENGLWLLGIESPEKM